MKTLKVIELLKQPDSYCIQFLDDNINKIEYILIVNGWNEYDLHWKVFNSLHKRGLITWYDTYTTIHTRSVRYKLKSP